MRVFGRREERVVYIPRPSVYGVAIDEAGRVAVMRTPKGCGLPGGGIEAGESIEAALRREVLEECGREISLGASCGEALEYVHARGEGYFLKECRFVRAVLGRVVAEPVERDHVLEWLEPEVAIERLTHRSQAWVVGFVTNRGA